MSYSSRQNHIALLKNPRFMPDFFPRRSGLVSRPWKLNPAGTTRNADESYTGRMARSR
jgi:hypothetical protein